MSQSEIDLRILAEMAEEISQHGYCCLPGSLRSLIKTKRGQAVGDLLEKQAHELITGAIVNNNTVQKLKDEVNELRNENQQLTDLVDTYSNQLERGGYDGPR